MIAIFMFKHHTRQIPKVCSDLFITNEEIHSYYTRQQNLLHVPVTNSSNQQKTIRFMGVKIWNKLKSNTVNTECTIFTFKRHLKKYLLYNSFLN